MGLGSRVAFVPVNRPGHSLDLGPCPAAEQARLGRAGRRVGGTAGAGGGPCPPPPARASAPH